MKAGRGDCKTYMELALSADETIRAATRALEAGEIKLCLSLLDAVLAERNSSHEAAAHFMKGLAFEYGGDDVEADLSRAVRHYRHVVHLVGGEDSAPLLYLASALLRMGGASNEASALKAIRAAGEIKRSPEVDLAFAYYHESVDKKYDAAIRSYLRAALRGRFSGFFGASRVMRLQGHMIRAALTDAVRVIVGPFIFMLIGRRARSSFRS